LLCKEPIPYNLFFRYRPHLSFPKACQPPSLILLVNIYHHRVLYSLLVALTLRFSHFHFYQLHWKCSLSLQVLL
jgi:hypothetical protein